jgi:uncharacterized membrane protein
LPNKPPKPPVRRATLGETPPSGALTPVLARNIRSLQKHRQREEAQASAIDCVATAVGGFAGSFASICVHFVVFGLWTVANLGWLPGITPWDPELFTLGIIASVEAIFLSTFVLIAQNRMSALAEKRADLDLQISLLSEHEITRLVTMISAIAEKVGAQTKVDHEVEELERDVAPEKVLDELEELEEKADAK